jgi:hypothetical protein
MRKLPLISTPVEGLVSIGRLTLFRGDDIELLTVSLSAALGKVAGNSVLIRD